MNGWAVFANWWPVFASFVAGIGGPAVVLKIFGERLLARQNYQHSKEMAQVAHERSILLAERQNAFSMGVNSHMATVAFDKYIEFCEEYVAAVSKALSGLIQDGNNDPMLDTRDFFEIRQKWALWLSREIDDKLDDFEGRFEQNAPFYGNASDAPAPIPNEFHVKQIIADLRESISTQEFATLRKTLIRSLATTPPVS